MTLVSGKGSSTRGGLQGWISTQKQDETAKEIPFCDNACENVTKRERKIARTKAMVVFIAQKYF